MRRNEDGTRRLFSDLAGAVFDGISAGHKPSRVVVAPGADVAWDDCCDGQLAVRLISVTFAYNGTSSDCAISAALTLGISLVRCVESVDSEGAAPGDYAVTADGNAIIRDAAEVSRVLQCWEHDDVLRGTVGTWTPLGPTGGCAGGEWTYTATTSLPL